MCQGCLPKGKKEIAEHTNSPVEQLFRDFANEKGAVRVGVGGMMMAFARSFADTKGVTDVKVYSFGEGSRGRERLRCSWSQVATAPSPG